MVDWYAPGFKAGGPIRSAVNFADQLENDLDIFVLTTDRDLGDTQAYPGILADQWVKKMTTWYFMHHLPPLPGHR